MRNMTRVHHSTGHRQPDPNRYGSISLYQGAGVKLASPVLIRAGRYPNAGGKRGKIAGWTAASRRRLRLFMLTQAAPFDWYTVGATFTVPGPVQSVEWCCDLWKRYCQRVRRSGWGMIWRVEVQKRGMLHWHSLLIVGPGEYKGGIWGPYDIAEIGVRSQDLQKVGLMLKESWWLTLDSLGPMVFDPPHPIGKRLITQTTALSALPGALERSAMIETGSMSRGTEAARDTSAHASGGQWLRYLQDHTSKRKQGQIGVGIGRQWGVVGRQHFERILPDMVVDLAPRDYHRVRRTLAKWARPKIDDKRCPFGWRHGYRSGRGRGQGSSVWFSRVESVERILEWAQGQPKGSAGEERG